MLSIISVFASDIEVDNKPLATQLGVAIPNVMLLIDDSGSMRMQPDQGNGGFDVSYAPNYDKEITYACMAGSFLANAGTVEVNVSKNGEYTGTPFISVQQGANRTYYGWGMFDDKTPATPEILDAPGSTRTCFIPEEIYTVRLHAYICDEFAACRSYSTVNDSYNPQVSTRSGNFLNWYFSGTLAEWGDNSVTGGFKDDFDNSMFVGGTNRDSTSFAVARNFPTEYVDMSNATEVRYANNNVVEGEKLSTKIKILGGTGQCGAGKGQWYQETFFSPDQIEINGSADIPNHPYNKTWFPSIPFEHGRRNFSKPYVTRCSLGEAALWRVSAFGVDPSDRSAHNLQITAEKRDDWLDYDGDGKVTVPERIIRGHYLDDNPDDCSDYDKSFAGDDCRLSNAEFNAWAAANSAADAPGFAKRECAVRTDNADFDAADFNPNSFCVQNDVARQAIADVNGHRSDYFVYKDTYNFGRHDWENINGDLPTRMRGMYANFIGYKPGFHEINWRLTTAIDVSKTIIRNINSVRLGLTSFFTMVSYDGGVTPTTDANRTIALADREVATEQFKYDTSGLVGPGGVLTHGLVDIATTGDADSAADIAAANANRESLLWAVDALSNNRSTPTAGTMNGIAGYFFQNHENVVVDGAGAATIGELFNVPLRNIADTVNTDETSGAVPAFDSTANIYDPVNASCRQNAIVVLTDGIPSGGDTVFGPAAISGFAPPNLPADWRDDSVFTDKVHRENYIRLAGFLFETDFFPLVEGTQNIESYIIAFGDPSTVDDPIWSFFGNAAGGGEGTNNYSATDGAELIDAMEEIVADINRETSSSASVAVSSVAELTTENFVYQALYQSGTWTGELNAFFLNSDGLFQNATYNDTEQVWEGTGAVSDSTAGLTPVWDTADILNAMYVIDEPIVEPAVQVYRDIDFRRIFTLNSLGTRGTEFIAAHFDTTAAAVDKVSDQMITDLSRFEDAELASVVNYLRGDISNELDHPFETSQKYRQRVTALSVDVSGTSYISEIAEDGGSILGDIINSSPTYVAEPPRPWDDINYGAANNRYSAFQNKEADRIPMVYVGANDGMLHAVNTVSTVNNVAYADVDGTSLTIPAGGELFSYIPSFISDNTVNNTIANTQLGDLVNPDYDHRYYVDAKPTASDVFVDFYGNNSPEWRTILVGGAGAGGMGYYALDVTCPTRLASSLVDGTTYASNCANESFDEGNVLWEFSTADDADVGLTFSQPIVAKVNFKQTLAEGELPDNGNGNGRWAAIVNNGYNSQNGRAALYILFLDGGLDGSWTEGEDYLKLFANGNGSVINSPLTADASDTSAAKNGLSSPQGVDVDKDGVLDRVYAGDLKGNVWVWDISELQTQVGFEADPQVMNWTVAKLFSAADGQSITTTPQLARNSEQRVPAGCNANIMVMFGTGIYLGKPDISDKSLQSVYAVHDRCIYAVGETDESGDIVSPSDISRNDLVKRAIVLDGDGDRVFAGDADILDLDIDFGWYLDLYTEVGEGSTTENASASEDERLGERFVFDGFIANDVFVFNTLTPDDRLCRSGVLGWSLAFDWTSGLALDRSVFDTDNNGTVDSTDDASKIGFNCGGNCSGASSPAGDNLISGGDNASSQKFKAGQSVVGRRLSWEELFSFGFSR
jgi:type IV pilus assembly protein PilY1